MSAALRKTYDRYAWIMAVLAVPLSRKKSRRRESKRCDAYELHSLISTTARQLAPGRGGGLRAVVGEV